MNLTMQNNSGGEIVLFGGWGHGNLGDEAILLGYCEFLDAMGVSFRIATPNMSISREAQGENLWPRLIRIEHALGRRLHRSDQAALICGGGYLNGDWRFNGSLKMMQTVGVASAGRRILHAVEVSHLHNPWQRNLVTRLARSSTISVRDATSAAWLDRAGAGSIRVVPDAISLLLPVLNRVVPDPRSAGRVLLNAVNVGSRPDRHEAGFDVGQWRRSLREIVALLGDRAVGFAVDRHDHEFMSEVLPNLDLIRVGSVKEFIGVLKGAHSVISTRMHPGLVASMAGKPTVFIPYSNKIGGVLSVLNLSDSVVSGRPEMGNRLEAEAVLERLQESSTNDEAWRGAHGVSSVYLQDALRLLDCVKE